MSAENVMWLIHDRRLADEAVSANACVLFRFQHSIIFFSLSSTKLLLSSSSLDIVNVVNIIYRKQKWVLCVRRATVLCDIKINIHTSLLNLFGIFRAWMCVSDSVCVRSFFFKTLILIVDLCYNVSKITTQQERTNERSCIHEQLQNGEKTYLFFFNFSVCCHRVKPYIIDSFWNAFVSNPADNHSKTFNKWRKRRSKQYLKKQNQNKLHSLKKKKKLNGNGEPLSITGKMVSFHLC